MNTGQPTDRSGKFVAGCALVGVMFFGGPSSGQTEDPGPKGSTNATDKAECEAQLLRIHAALQQYVVRNHRLPDWLSDLSRERLIPEEILTCPYVHKTFTLVEWRRDVRGDCFRDKKSSYSYEFCAAELPLFGGATTTWREYKERALKLMGTNVVPIVRCFAHRPVLNLTYDGSIYESGMYWEDKFADRVSHAEITPEALFPERVHLPNLQVGDFPPRALDLSWQQLDLAHFYNARLTDTWLHAPSFADDLSELPAGTLETPGARFDARGIVQLKGNTLALPYPLRLENIPIGKRCAAFQFLHATASQAPPGTQVGRYVLHFADGSAHEIPLLYGRDLAAWWQDAKVAGSRTLQVAWQGKRSDSLRGGRTIRLYRSRYENPKPTLSVESLDFISANSSAAPFLIAVTLE